MAAPSDIATLLRDLGFGRLFYQVWHRPAGALLRSLREGGPLGQWRTEAGRRRMVAAAAALGPAPAGKGAPLSVHVLTGARFWYQTAFCLRTLEHHACRVVAPVLHDDGTLSGESRDALIALFPEATVITIDAAKAGLQAYLPGSRYPVLNERWSNYPNIRKLIDPHLGALRGWKLVLDSDMLFHRRPTALLDWCDAPDAPLHAVDCIESYGYGRPLMERLAGAPLPPRVNVGVCGLESGMLDWEELEHWCSRLIAAERTSYYLEQALVAMLIARQARRCVLPEADYVTGPTRDEALLPRAAMHHFVDTSKRWYFRHCWRPAFAACTRAPASSGDASPRNGR